MNTVLLSLCTMPLHMKWTYFWYLQNKIMEEKEICLQIYLQFLHSFEIVVLGFICQFIFQSHVWICCKWLICIQVYNDSLTSIELNDSAEYLESKLIMILDCKIWTWYSQAQILYFTISSITGWALNHFRWFHFYLDNNYDVIYIYCLSAQEISLQHTRHPTNQPTNQPIMTPVMHVQCISMQSSFALTNCTRCWTLQSNH